MISFSAILLKFIHQGEKTGWTYLEVPKSLTDQLKPGNKKSFRVKGMLDDYNFNGMALIPMGEGAFIMPLNAGIRKAIKKEKGDIVAVQLTEDHDYVVLIPLDLLACLNEEPDAYGFFQKLSKSNREYFIKWIDAAKTIATRDKRVVQTVIGLSKGLKYGQMIRMFKNKPG